MRFEGGGKRCVELNGAYLVGHVITFLNDDHDVSNNDSSIGGSKNNNSYEHEQMPTVETAVTHMQYNPRFPGSIHSCFLDAASEGLTFDKMQQNATAQQQDAVLEKGEMMFSPGQVCNSMWGVLMLATCCQLSWDFYGLF